MKKLILITILMSNNFLMAQENQIVDRNENGLPDQHESAILRSAERICNMPGIQQVLTSQIDELRKEKEILQKQLEELKNKSDQSLLNQQQQCTVQLKEKDVEKDKVLADKDKVILNLNDKNQELIMCKAKLDEKLWDRVITAGIGIVGSTGCLIYQEVR
jgi:predicted nuclease with TOPRIM domain